LRKRGDELDRAKRTLSIALVEVTFDTTELIGDMGKANDRNTARGRKCIERSCFHLDCKNPFMATQRYAFGRLTKRRVRSPRRASMDMTIDTRKRVGRTIEQCAVRINIR
jgi:hypothetical protein